MGEICPQDEFDFHTWLAELRASLQVAGDGYSLRDPDDDGVEFLEGHWPPIPSNRTAFAWLTVATVMQSIRKLPHMRDHAGLVPLHDLVAALIDLGQGGKPRLLQPIRGIGKGKESTQRRWVRQHVLLFVEMLVAGDMRATEACKEVASIMSHSGHVGRKQESRAKGLSWKTIEAWWTAKRQRDFAKNDPRLVAFLDRSIERIKNEHGWPLRQDAAKALIKSMATSGLLSSKT